MNYRRLGSTGLQISELSFGAWVTFGDQIGQEMAERLMRVAFDAGVNYFDNAESYSGGKAETIMGNVFKSAGWARETFVVSTKFYWGLRETVNQRNTLNRKYLLEAINGSLKRLQLDYVDIVFAHRPDPDTPIAETVWAMHKLIESDKALYWGTSEWSAYEIVSALYLAEKYRLHKPVTEQSHYNMFTREKLEKEYLRLFQEHHYGDVIWSPLASGFLSGKYNNGIPADSRAAQPGYEWLQKTFTSAERIEKVKQLAPIASDLGATMAQLAIAWCLKNPYLSSVILGASRPEQLQENLGALAIAPQLTPETLERIENVLQNKPR
ncbi:MAG: potassium channel subunit [Chloroflexota bacterium]|nr:MAG: potassium channel subunit [Chloroflexota bacterium]